MGILSNFSLALDLKKEKGYSFKNSWKIVNCVTSDHLFAEHENIQKKIFDKHPNKCEDTNYVVTMFRCKNCGCVSTKSKLEFKFF
jgi:hypothetical protein